MIYRCSNCNKNFETNKKLLNPIKYCSQECRNTLNGFQTVDCINCKQPFVKRTKAIDNLCSRVCYHKYKKGKIPDCFKDGPLTANTPQAIEKRRKTCVDKGLWSDANMKVENMTFEVYKILGKLATLRNKKQLFENWDGTDFYDGEYIKDYLKLDYRDKKYPTIDHKISMLNGFKNKISIEEITDIKNLAITKRTINSKKQSKNYNELL